MFNFLLFQDRNWRIKDTPAWDVLFPRPSAPPEDGPRPPVPVLLSPSPCRRRWARFHPRPGRCPPTSSPAGTPRTRSSSNRRRCAGRRPCTPTSSSQPAATLAPWSGRTGGSGGRAARRIRRPSTPGSNLIRVLQNGQSYDRHINLWTNIC